MGGTHTRRFLRASDGAMEGIAPWWELAGGGDDERQSATARRSGSGGFLEEEDLRREAEPATPSCSNRELPGLWPGLKVEDMNQISPECATLAARSKKTFFDLVLLLATSCSSHHADELSSSSF